MRIENSEFPNAAVRKLPNKMTTFFLLCTILSLSTSFGVTSVEVPPNDVSVASNLDTETQCASGRCPLGNATCCSSRKIICCPHGTICLDKLDLCFGILSDEGKAVTPVLYTEKPTKLIQSIDCPRFMTPCYGRCCPLYQAVCCSDGLHCCPYGTTCNPPYCDGDASARFLNGIFQRPPTKKHSKSVAKSVLPQTAVINPKRTGAQAGAPDESNLNTETACASGWCPHANATCCHETQTCCREGAVCLGPLKLCIGIHLDEKNGVTPAVYSEKAANLRQNSGCQKYETPCYGGCCPLYKAVCCPDQLTCCSNGYICAGPLCLEDEDAPVSTQFLSRIFQRPSIPNPTFNSVENSILPLSPAVSSDRSGAAAILCCVTIYPPFFDCCFEPLRCTFFGCKP